MTRTDLIEAIAQDTGSDRQQAKAFLEGFTRINPLQKASCQIGGHFKFVTRLLFELWTDLRKHGGDGSLRPDSNFGCSGTNGVRKCKDDGNCCDLEPCHGSPQRRLEQQFTLAGNARCRK